MHCTGLYVADIFTQVLQVAPAFTQGRSQREIRFEKSRKKTKGHRKAHRESAGEG